jgi:hypothetical protein
MNLLAKSTYLSCSTVAENIWLCTTLRDCATRFRMTWIGKAVAYVVLAHSK